VLDVAEVTVRFGDRTVLDRVSLHAADAEVVALLGPSGSGKSTLLRVIAGIVVPDTGRVAVGGVDVTALPTHRRSVGMVFQDEQLFPHLSVAGNVEFALKVRGDSTSTRAEAVDRWIRVVGLGGFEDRHVDGLSGGERKRVALARSLAPQPAVLLLDEPLTGLDRELHDRLAGEVRVILRTAGVTAVWVTHDPTEANVVADRTVRLADLTGTLPP
jgi:thiamine transport system ATP-binding protein